MPENLKRKRWSSEGADHSATSSPSSSPRDSAPASAGPKALKDRTCPFCHQPFTSSSLGRHLDLYIKPKNPKPSDGLHLVDEIRRIRGAITRRQPKRSSRPDRERDSWRREARSEASATPAETPVASDRIEPARSVVKAASPTGRSVVRAPTTTKGSSNASPNFVNHASWQATGVINDIPRQTPSQDAAGKDIEGWIPRIREIQYDSGLESRSQRTRLASDGPASSRSRDPSARWQEQAETGRAMEMALREVLDSIVAADKQPRSLSIFDDVDFCTLSFPALCLAILPAPSTLFSTTPFPSGESWDTNPPGSRQRDGIRRLLADRINERRAVDGYDSVLHSIGFTHNSHLEIAFDYWCQMSDAERSATWTLEILRSFTRERQAHEEVKVQLAYADQRVSHLESEFERLSRCQLPREGLLRPPNTVPVSPPTMAHLRRSRTAAGEVDFDADALIERWRGAVRSVARPTANPSSSALAQPHYATSAMRPSNSGSGEPGTMPLIEDMISSGAVFGVGGPMPRPAQTVYRSQKRIPSHETPPEHGTVMSIDGDGGVHSEGEQREDGAGDYEVVTEHSALVRPLHTRFHHLHRAGPTASGKSSPSMTKVFPDERRPWGASQNNLSVDSGALSRRGEHNLPASRHEQLRDQHARDVARRDIKVR